jgi:hypothetical protein
VEEGSPDLILEDLNLTLATTPIQQTCALDMASRSAVHHKWLDRVLRTETLRHLTLIDCEEIDQIELDHQRIDGQIEHPSVQIDHRARSSLASQLRAPWCLAVDEEMNTCW